MILDIAENLKKVLPNSVIFLGGPEVSFESWKDSFGLFVYWFRNKRRGWKNTFLTWQSRFVGGNIDFSKIKGITYRNGKNIISNMPESELNPDDIPFSSGNLSDMENRIIYYEIPERLPV